MSSVHKWAGGIVAVFAGLALAMGSVPAQAQEAGSSAPSAAVTSPAEAQDAAGALVPGAVDLQPGAADLSADAAESEGVGAEADSAQAGQGSTASAPEHGSSREPASEQDSPRKKTRYCSYLDGRKGVTAEQVIEVRQTSESRADVYLCSRKGDRYVRDSTSYTGHLGYNGVTSEKREGDGKTPRGVFWMRGGFGTGKNPGLDHQPWTKVTEDHVWVDGKASKAQGYNTMQRRSQGYKGESLHQTGPYRYAQVIGYNEARTPGKGSAIFLHKHTASGTTAGCVSLSEKSLVKTLKWQKSAKVQMVIH